ncbi:CHAP domain-containing protein [Intrasporangium sp. YIM S08009]|uniref:CHAP domain-containing protein n=1 Tax=Intrasporangium zincisolvens TaxID=3080018 RepID=UPI002B057C5A|nr:CHAP domain-containing protein [Intrasporangium sp. YIM S08009]
MAATTRPLHPWRRRLVVLVAALATTLTSLGVAAPARAAEWIVLCTGYDACNAAGYPDAGYKANAAASWWRQSTGHNCTAYVAYRLVQNGLPNTKPTSLSGNASNWGPSFPAQTNTSPAVGSIAWWDTSYSSTGHVAYVEQVLSASDIIISEDNWGGDFRWRRVTLTGGRWPKGFIHLKDQGPTVATDTRAWQVAAPARLLDTKTGLGAPVAKVGAGKAVTVQVTGRAGVPATGVDTVLLNVNATAPAAAGYVTAHANGTAQPGSRALSFAAGGVTTTLVLSRLGTDGKVRLYSSATTDLSADLVGWSPTGGYVSGAAPARVLDTRTGVGTPKARLAAGGTLTLPLAGKAGIPASGVGAVLLDVSASTPSAAGFLTTWPAGAARPAAPQVRYETASPATGLVEARLGTGGAVTIHSTAQTDVLVDVVGWLPTGADQVALGPTRVLDSQTGLGYPTGRVAAGQAPLVPVVGKAGVPTSGVRAAVLTVTVVSPTAAGYVTAYPSGSSETPYATVKYASGRTVTNTVLVPVGLDGSVRLKTSAAAYLKVDVQGYIRW